MVALPRTSVAAAVAVCAATGFGCVQDTRFNPSGCDVHLDSTWTVTGLDPRVAGVCNPSNRNNEGIAEVLLLLFDPTTSDDPEKREAWRDPEDLLLFDCNPTTDPHAVDGTELDQNFGGGSNPPFPITQPPPNFLNSDSDEAGVRRNRCGNEGDAGKLLRAGTYDYRWVARSGIGEVIDCTAKVLGHDFSAGTVTLPPVDFQLGPGRAACDD